jgi:hypothetical protein
MKSNGRPNCKGKIYGAHRMTYGEFPPGAYRSIGDADGLETVAAWECHADCPIRQLDAMSGTLKGDRPGRKPRANRLEAWRRLEGREDHPDSRITDGFTDSGGASRFFATFPGEAEALYFYAPKASRRDRGEGNLHPTVKSQALMRWLIRLICKPGDMLIDPFAGSGSTLLAALAEGVNAIGIEDDSEPGSFATAERRLAAARLPLGFG